MKVLIVTPEYPPYACGGGGAVAQMIAQGLAKKGHKITVMSGYYPKKMLNERPHKNWDEEIGIIWIPLMRMMETKFPQLRGSMPPNPPSLLFLKTKDYAEYDVIHLCAFGHLLIDYVNLVAKNPRKILTIHAFPKYVEKGGGASFPLRLLYRIYYRTLGINTLKSAKAITSVSKFTARECVERGIPENKIVVIENGIDLEKYKPVNYDELEQKFHLQKEDVVILSISRVTWYKGYEYALKAIYEVVKASNKSIKYMIVGSIEDRNYYWKLSKQVEKLGLKNNVILSGFLNEKLKLQALSRANIFLAPSLHEGFGLVILEAMALGKPAIASNCEGFRCILEHMKTGILVKPANSEEVANAIRLLLSNPDMQEKLLKNAFSEAQKYSWKKVVERYEGLYERILAGMYEKATRSRLNGI